MRSRLAEAKSISSTLAGMREQKNTAGVVDSKKQGGGLLTLQPYNTVLGDRIKYVQIWRQMCSGVQIDHWLNYYFSMRFSEFEKKISGYSKAVEEFEGSLEKCQNAFFKIAMSYYHVLTNDAKYNLATVSTKGLAALLKRNVTLNQVQWKKILSSPAHADLIAQYQSGSRQFIDFYNALSLSNQHEMKICLRTQITSSSDFLIFLKTFKVTSQKYSEMLSQCSSGVSSVMQYQVQPGESDEFTSFLNSLLKNNRISILFSTVFKRSCSWDVVDVLCSNRAIKKDDLDITDFIRIIKLRFKNYKKALALTNRSEIDRILHSLSECCSNPQLIAKTALFQQT